MSGTQTLCGYELADVRRALRDAIDRRDTHSASRWTAELVATPGAVGSLWASYWLAWAVITGGASPTLPILLRQGWDRIADAAHAHGGDWVAFRNDPPVRAIAAEMTSRLLVQSRQTPVVWPSKEIIIYDVGTLRAGAMPPDTDGGIVLRVWQRNDDALDLRMMAGYWLSALRRDDLRAALSAVAWTMLPHAQQGLATHLKCAERGPAALTVKQRSSPIWFWLEIGRALIMSRTGLHRGWYTMHTAVADAFRTHYKRWTAADRMRVLLAWILQIRASFQPQPETLWAAEAMRIDMTSVDTPYREIAVELADPVTAILKAATPEKAEKPEKEGKKAAMAKAEAKMLEADAKIMAMMGLSEDDI